MYVRIYVPSCRLALDPVIDTLIISMTSKDSRNVGQDIKILNLVFCILEGKMIYKVWLMQN